jgi:hypothetical protein
MAQSNIDEINRQMADEKETAEILKKSLVIVDKLSKMDADDIFADDDEMEKLEKLIDEAKKLSKHRLWKLK